jgi:hypothetical protein
MMALLYCPALLSAQTPDLLLCPGHGYTLTSTADASGASQITYEWYENDTPVGNSNSTALNMSSGKASPGTYTYVRKASSSDCQEPVSSNAFVVIVVPTPNAPVISASTAAVCQNAGDIVFSIPPAANTAYNWSGSDGTPSGGDNSSYTVSSAAYGAKSVTATASVTYTVGGLDETCTSGASNATSAEVHPLPVVSQTAYDEECGKGEKHLGVEVMVGDASSSNVTVSWYAGASGGSALQSGDDKTFTTPSLTETTNYYVAAAEKTTGCESAGRATVEAKVDLNEGSISGTKN